MGFAEVLGEGQELMKLVEALRDIGAGEEVDEFERAHAQTVGEREWIEVGAQELLEDSVDLVGGGRVEWANPHWG